MRLAPADLHLFWQLLAGGLVALAALWWLLLGAGRRARRAVLRQRIAALDAPAGTDSALAALSGLRRGIADAVSGLVRPNGRPTAGARLYRVPWFLFIGDDEAGVPALLRAAQRAAAPTAHRRDDTDGAFWRWWFLGPMTAIETDADAVCDASAQRERVLWHQALLALVERRERLPLNGLVVCVGTQTLLSDAAQIDATAMRLRRLADEASELLRLRLPLYLVVTGLEHLRGHRALLGALPPAVLAQALGHRLAHDAAPNDPAAHFDALFAAFAARLDGLRMGLVRALPRPHDRLGAHVFIENMKVLEPGLRRLAQHLCDAPQLPWRGLYFVSAGDAHGAPDAFVHDLVMRLLPADQALARPRN